MFYNYPFCWLTPSAGLFLDFLGVAIRRNVILVVFAADVAMLFLHKIPLVVLLAQSRWACNSCCVENVQGFEWFRWETRRRCDFA